MLVERLRDGLIWSYAVLTLAEEQRAHRREAWESETIRLREEARERVDDFLKQREIRRDGRQQRMRERLQDALGQAGLASSAQVAELQDKIDRLTAKLEEFTHTSMADSHDESVAEKES